MKTFSLLTLGAVALLLATPAQAESPNWQSAHGAFEAMAKSRKPGIFWFHGDGIFHNSLSHKFHQKDVVALLRKFTCVQVPGPGGRSPDEEPIAKRFGIGKTIGTIVVCHYDGTEIMRYGDVVETRDFIPVVREWILRHARRVKETGKAQRALDKAREQLDGNVSSACLRVSQVLAKAKKISKEVVEQARAFERELLARAEGELADARRTIQGGDTEAGHAKAAEVRRTYGRLTGVTERVTALLEGATTIAGSSPLTPGPRVVRRKDGRLDVIFRFRAAPGQRVNVAGSFNGWSASANPLSDPDGDGTFEGTVTVAFGRISYKFVIGGQRWLSDPDNPRGEPDGHGGQNSLLDPAATN